MIFIIFLKNNSDLAIYNRYLPPTVETKGFSVIIDRKNIFEQPIKMIDQGKTFIKTLKIIKEMIKQSNV